MVMNNTEVLLVVGGLSTLIFNVSILYITLHTMSETREAKVKTAAALTQRHREMSVILLKKI